MKDYSVLNAAGAVVRTGTCQAATFDAQAINAGETVVEGHLPVTISEPVYSWSVNRQMAYPSITDFVDAMFWMDRGDDSKLKAYFAACAAVKAQFPKDK